MNFYKKNALYAAGFLGLIVLMVSTFSLSIAQQQKVIEIGGVLEKSTPVLKEKRSVQHGVVIYSAPDTSLVVDAATPFFARTYQSAQSTKVTIEYNIPETQRVKVEVFDVNNTYSETLVNVRQEPGNYKVYFDGSERKSGLYICKITVNKDVWIEPMLLVK